MPVVQRIDPMSNPHMGKRLRTCAYCRVSSNSADQLNSYATQVRHYTKAIQSRSDWEFVDIFADEGITGTRADKRTEFQKMIRLCQHKRIDLIITKSVSRFARNTAECIEFVRLLKLMGIGVIFEEQNIDTLKCDSELLMTIHAGFAQAESESMSRNITWSYRKRFENGEVIFSYKNMLGYRKGSDGQPEIIPEEAEIVRIIFDLYANHRLGTRKISQKLFEMGYTSREGNAFNVLTIRHMLENPKYKGWYCGNKTQNLDYRTKKKAFLDESEWVMYPDPTIPAIVSEELWDRANALYKERRNEMMSHSSGVTYHNRYPYSAKIICEEHGTTFHRQVLKSAAGDKEVWQCKVYRQKGRAACSAPQIRSEELDIILAEIFTKMMKDKQAIIDALVKVSTRVPKEVDFEKMIAYAEGDIAATKVKKDRLLDLHIAGAITTLEFKEHNDALNVQLKNQESQLAAIQQEQIKAGSQDMDVDAIRRKLDKELSFTDGINTALVAAILDKVIVKKESTKGQIHLEILLKLEHKYEAIYSPHDLPASINSSRSIMHSRPIRRI